MDSEKPWVTLHFCLGSNLEHLTFCYICLVMFAKSLKAGLYLMILKIFFQPKWFWKSKNLFFTCLGLLCLALLWLTGECADVFTQPMNAGQFSTKRGDQELQDHLWNGLNAAAVWRAWCEQFCHLPELFAKLITGLLWESLSDHYQPLWHSPSKNIVLVCPRNT